MLDPWLVEFWKIVMDLYPLPNGCLPVSEEILPAPKYAVNCDTASVVTPRPSSELFNATVVCNQRVTSPDHFQDVRLIKMNIEGSGMTFEPGDVVVVYPENCEEDIYEFFRLFSLKADMHISVAPMEEGAPLPHFLAAPFSLDRSFFELFWHFGGSDLEKERLREFSTTGGQEDLVEYAIRPRRTVLEVFTDFPHTTANVPLAYLFDLIPPIRPRYFSIANSLRCHPGQIHILAAIVNFRTKLKKPRRYVQHQIAEHEDKVWQLLCDGGVLYIAGNAKDMVPSVRDAFKAVVKKSGSLTDESAEELLKNLEKSRRLQIEAWS
ncbi:hypothetical protein V5799_007510 [Amblyomma americanum]|uniref:FAD-binding FR-type domain-containing protein n=1 Tax=Amblyomma americanum TaxID=6943 RepID=A0AAQ4FH70_AMBAM